MDVTHLFQSHIAYFQQNPSVCWKFVQIWDQLKNSITVNIRHLYLQPFRNSHFYVLTAVELSTFQVPCLFPKITSSTSAAFTRALDVLCQSVWSLLWCPFNHFLTCYTCIKPPPGPLIKWLWTWIQETQFAHKNWITQWTSTWKKFPITFLLLPTWYTNFLFIHTNYMKLNSSTCFERNPLIIRRSTTQIVHMQPLVSSLSASDRLVQPLRKDFLSGRRSLAESDDTGGCICTICVVYLLMMSGLISKHVEEFNLM